MSLFPSILACSTCASAFQHAGDDAAGWSIAVMLFVIIPLAIGVVWSFVRLARRESAALDPKYCDDYISPASNS